MANIDMVVQTINLQVFSDGSPSQAQLNLKTSTGGNVVTTGGAFSMVFNQNPVSPLLNPPAPPDAPAVALISYASGISVLSLTGGIGAPAGRYEMLFTPSGGSAQVCATGTLTCI